MAAAEDRDSWFLAVPVVETPRMLRRSPGTAAIIALSLTAVAAGGIWPEVTRTLESTKEALADGEVWRLLTYVFPHGGWDHVSFNMGVLSLFGWQLERRVGTGRFVAIYLGCGAIGMALLSAFNPIGEERGLRHGASLAVFGVVAALSTWHAAHGGIRGRVVPWAAGTCLALLVTGGLLGLGGHEGVVDPGINGFAFGFLNHALGMIAGVLLGIVTATTMRPTVRWSGAALTVVVTVAAVLIGIARWT